MKATSCLPPRVLSTRPLTPFPLSTAQQPNVQEIETSWNLLNDACDSGDLALFKSAFKELRQSANHDLDNRLHHYMNSVVAKGYTNIVSFLLDNGAVIGDAPLSATSLIEDSKENGNTNTVIRTFEMLFDYGLDLQEFPDILHSIVDDESILKYLLSKGANPNGLDDFGHTPLACTSNEASVKILVNSGADFSCENLLHNALRLRDDQDWEARMTFLLDVIGVDINAQATYSVKESIPPGSRFYPKWLSAKGHAGTALHWATSGFGNRVEEDMKPKVKWLLEHGADVDVRDDEGLKAADYAKDQKMADLFETYKKTA